MENMQGELIMKFVKPELLVLIVVLYFIGNVIKKSKIKDNYIPLILGGIGILLSGLYILATTEINGYKELMVTIFTIFTQGVLCSAGSVYINQMWKQLKDTKVDDTKDTKEEDKKKEPKKEEKKEENKEETKIDHKYVLDSEWGTRFKNFKKEEFKCKCGKCNGYGKGIATSLLVTMQELRDKTGKPIVITSGYRCTDYNKKVGGVSNSKHLIGQACDFYQTGYNSQTKREKVVNELKNTKYYHYSYTNVNGNYPNMGQAIHIDTKLVDIQE